MDQIGLDRDTLTVAQAAKVCGVNRVTMWRWVKANDLPATTTLGGHHRIKRSDLNAFMRQNGKGNRGFGDDGRILIVDDDVQIQKLMSRTLESRGYAVETCSNGFEAGIRVMRFKPHLIVLDLFMPYMDGFRVCQLLKNDPETASVKIIAISGHSKKADINKVLQYGADLFLAKPLGKGQLVHHVESLIQSRLTV